MIVLIDARSDSLTVTWPEVPGAKRYVLELKTMGAAGSGDDGGGDGGGGGFRELSSKLTQTQARKKNLAPGGDHFFRVAPVMNDDGGGVGSWITQEGEPFRTLSVEDDERAMEAPEASIGGNKALVVRWKPEGETNNTTPGYELQMRDNRGGEGWTTIAGRLKGTEARKKNLSPGSGYQFRVKPVSGKVPFSPPSQAVVAKGISEALRKRWFWELEAGTLLKKKHGASSSVPLADAVGGKEFVLFYVSAHWCPPCRKYTPMLANWYNTTNATNHDCCEVIFVSADHDEAGFTSYFNSSHPWSAIAYDDDETARQSVMAALKVQGIPRLVVVDASTGNIVENNAVGKPLDVNQWRRTAQNK